jgi:hypothetical protein
MGPNDVEFAACSWCRSIGREVEAKGAARWNDGSNTVPKYSRSVLPLTPEYLNSEVAENGEKILQTRKEACSSSFSFSALSVTSAFKVL